MLWEDIDAKSKRVVERTVRELVGEDIAGEETNSLATDEEENLVREFLRTDLLQTEKIRRDRYDYQKAFRIIKRKRYVRLIQRMVGVAACLVLVLGGILWYKGNLQKQPELPLVGVIPSDNQVILTLSDGRAVVLVSGDSLQLQEGRQIIQVHKGALTYGAETGRGKGEQPIYNTVVVPQGAEYRVVLADGTLVHLNAATELRYPVAFGQQKREVFLKGEAWFEVTKESERPFYVRTDGIQIKVYGTKFNVNTHRLRTVQTVLAEGSIGIKPENGGEEIRMQPGQLAEYDRKNLQVRVRKVDIRQYIAWREGIFYFNDESLEEIMLELGRWYGMEVFFRSNKAKEARFFGHLARYEDIRTVLNTVTESIDVEFEISGKTIIVK